MRARRWLAFATLLVLGPAAARADPAAGADGRNRAGLALGGVLPVGGWRDDTGAAGAAWVWLEVPVSPWLAITARAGAIVHAPATIELGARASLVEAPVLGGARFQLARRGRLRVLAGGDVGLVVAHTRVTIGGVTEGDTGLRIGAALAAGLAVDRVAIEAGPWLADLGDVDQAIGVQLTASVRLRAW